MSKTLYSADEYKKALELIRAGKTRKEVAEHFGLTYSVATSLLAKALTWEARGSGNNPWFDLSERARNCLMNEFERELLPSELLQLPISRIAEIPNAGTRTILEIVAYAISASKKDKLSIFGDKPRRI